MSLCHDCLHRDDCTVEPHVVVTMCDRHERDWRLMRHRGARHVALLVSVIMLACVLGLCVITVLYS